MKSKNPIQSLILPLRGQKVILDADLAELYAVPTKAFTGGKAQRRPIPPRFPLPIDRPGVEPLEVTDRAFKCGGATKGECCSELVTICDQFQNASRRCLLRQVPRSLARAIGRTKMGQVTTTANQEAALRRKVQQLDLNKQLALHRISRDAADLMASALASPGV